MHEDPVTSSSSTTRVPGERLELGEGREVVLNVTLSNTGDPAYFAWVTLNFRHARNIQIFVKRVFFHGVIYCTGTFSSKEYIVRNKSSTLFCCFWPFI
jgi:hypothetical protein